MRPLKRSHGQGEPRLAPYPFRGPHVVGLRGTRAPMHPWFPPQCPLPRTSVVLETSSPATGLLLIQTKPITLQVSYAARLSSNVQLLITIFVQTRRTTPANISLSPSLKWSTSSAAKREAVALDCALPLGQSSSSSRIYRSAFTDDPFPAALVSARAVAAPAGAAWCCF